MSSIAITGNASGAGVFTIASPNSASSYTLTLPTATTTVVGTDATQTLTNKTLTTPNIDSAQFATVSGTAPIYPCRAWVTWTMSGTTVTVRASGNVSSVTRTGSGTFNIVFTSAMPDGYYCANVTGQRPSANNSCVGAIQQGTTPSTTTLAVGFTEDSATGIDPTFACIQVVR